MILSHKIYWSISFDFVLLGISRIDVFIHILQCCVQKQISESNQNMSQIYSLRNWIEIFISKCSIQQLSVKETKYITTWFFGPFGVQVNCLCPYFHGSYSRDRRCSFAFSSAEFANFEFEENEHLGDIEHTLVQ